MFFFNKRTTTIFYLRLFKVWMNNIIIFIYLFKHISLYFVNSIGFQQIWFSLLYSGKDRVKLANIKGQLG